MSGEHGELTTRTFVDVHAIQDELEEVRWGLHENGEFSEAAQHAAAEARASVLNLIAVVGSERQLTDVSHTLDALSVTNPSRTLILLAQHDRSAAKLEAEVSAQTRTESGHRVTTERVLLHAHGDVAAHLASLVTPLLIPDLPVVLWWPGRPDFDNPLFDDLCELADRLVVDTDEGFEPPDLKRLLEIARRNHAGASIGDFNWARLIPWRHLAAQFFDIPGMLAHLAQIHGVAVYYGRDGSTTQARLLGGWIQGRMASVGIDVPVEFRPDDAYEHGVSQFQIYSRGPDGQARFSISHQPGGRLSTEVRVGEQDFVDRTVRLARRAAEELLAIELTLPGHDVLFEEALAASLR
ncbi:MAG TPA: glucose-6-phosphate dehydrogenase assembly protein OpcA [Candidatus Dormibacteraeota bacterium]|nr:glucose-6-phosphate dehydrogenase assembly protein OpcA [Candidatus Dormibacteraeota bacterium]